MVLNPTVTFKKFENLQKSTLPPLPPLGPKPEGQSYEKKGGPEGVEKSKIGRSEAAKWSGDAQ